MLQELFMAAVVAGSLPPNAQAQRAAGTHPVLELRQYKIVHGKRDAFIELFDGRFVESQEALGMRLVGQFRDMNDPDRFTWIRAFADMKSRERALSSFYTGPVWLANREQANPMLDDNDNVLLLRPARSDFAFPGPGRRPELGSREGGGKPVIAVIEYLWNTPDKGFTAFFATEFLPALRSSGLDLLGAYVPEEAENNFPRLPVRPDRKIFVWFATAADKETLGRALDALREEPGNAAMMGKLRDFEERSPQPLWLEPTARSALR